MAPPKTESTNAVNIVTYHKLGIAHYEVKFDLYPFIF